MLDRKYITENFEEASTRLERRGFELPEDILVLDDSRRLLDYEVSTVRGVANEESRSLASLKRAGGLSEEDFEQRVRAGRIRREEIQELETRRGDISQNLTNILLGVPNFPDERVPEGESDADNVVVRQWGDDLKIGEGFVDHSILGKQLGILDTETGAKIAAARFAVLRGKGAKLSRALSAFMLDMHEEQGYVEHTVPHMVNQASMQGTGQLPKFEDDLFKTSIGDRTMYLSPTAEVQLTNMHSGDILAEADLPIKYTALSTNFRSEAGSAGRDVSGIFRQHQFDKVELVQMTKPEDSWTALETLTGDAERVLKALGLAYQVVAVCTGDLSFGSSFTYDIEAWLPGQQAYREISSCSNFTDFQARRNNTRYRRESNGQVVFPHTLNGSALAVGRTMIAIMEQNQKPDGSISIPEALQDYTRFSSIEA